jgi:CRP-like cAMP-binding protein
VRGLKVQETRGKGELLGEASFFFRLRHINTAVVAEGSTMLFVLSYDDYQQLSSAYVNDAAAVMDIIIELVNGAGKAGKSQGSASSGGSGNEALGMPHTSA